MTREELKQKTAELVKSGYDIRDILFFMSGYAPNTTAAELADTIFTLRYEGYNI